MTGRDALREALLSADVLVGEAVGAHGLTVGLDRPMVRTPLSESAAIGAALGMAVAGKRVVVELIDPAGVARAADVLRDAYAVREGFSIALVVLVVVGPEHPLPAGPVAALPCDVGPMLDAALAGGKPTILTVTRSALDGRVEPIPTPVRRVGERIAILAAGEGVALALATPVGEVVDIGVADPALVAERVRRSGRAILVTHGDTSPLVSVIQQAFWTLEAPPLTVNARDGVEAVSRAVAETLAW